ncbi:unnamed protein product [Arctogadus glacialis]
MIPCFLVDNRSTAVGAYCFLVDLNDNSHRGGVGITGRPHRGRVGYIEHREWKYKPVLHTFTLYTPLLIRQMFAFHLRFKH